VFDRKNPSRDTCLAATGRRTDRHHRDASDASSYI